MNDGLLYRHVHRGDGLNDYVQFIVPQKIRTDIFKHMHTGLSSGHVGNEKTVQKVLQSFYWFELRQDITLMVSKCYICAANKKPIPNPKAELGDMRTGSPWDRLMMDILGPLPTTVRNNKYILVIADAFSKWTEIFAIPGQTAPTCAGILLNEVIVRYGCPFDLHTDQGRSFENIIIQDICRLHGIRKHVQVRATHNAMAKLNDITGH